MSEKFREKLGVYLNDELEELKYLRSLSPHHNRLGSRSPRYLSHSPKPNRAEKSSINISMPATTSQHDSRPSIAAWPTPVAAENVLTVKPRLKAPPTISTTDCSDTLSLSVNTRRCAAGSVSPIPHSTASQVAASTPPYSASPQHSPRLPHQSQHQQNVESQFHQDSSKLLSMLKVVAASSTSPGLY